MSPVSRSRKKPDRAGDHPGRSSSPFAAVLADAHGLLDESSPVTAQAWASHVLGAIWLASWSDDIDGSTDPDDFMQTQIAELVEYAAAGRTPVGLAVLRALTTVGERWSRELAEDAADQVARSGVAEPQWAGAAAGAEFTGGYTTGDPFGDVELVALGFRAGGAEHLVIALLAHLDGPHLVKIIIGDASAGDLVAVAKEISGNAAMSEPRPLSAAQARVCLEEPLEVLLAEGPAVAELVGDVFEGVDGEPATGWALLRARLDGLPGDGSVPDERDFDEPAGDGPGSSAVADFLASGHAQALPDRELARGWAELVVGWADDCGRSPYRWGPLSLGFFLMQEVAPHVVIEDTEHAAFTATVGAWVRFAAAEHGLAAPARQLWEEQGPVVLTQFFEAYADPDTAAHRAACPDAVRLRSYDRLVHEQALADGAFESMSASLARLERADRGTAAAGGPASVPPAPADAAGTVHQIKVALRGTRPATWRRLEVASTATLGQLHGVIQAAFGWDDDHLWMFETDSGRYGPSRQLGHWDPDATTLAQVAVPGAQLRYLFDFGDEWDHTITVEKVLPAAPAQRYPRCTGGRQPDPVQYPDEDYPPAGGGFEPAMVNTRLAALR